MKESVRSNYLGTKFLLDNLKKDKQLILKTSNVLKSYSVQFLSKDVLYKAYYDTPDFYLQSKGIVININSFKGKNIAELVVRYESDKKRIEFLSNIPDTFAKDIPAKSSFKSHTEFIKDAIQNLMPYGIEVDVEKLIKQCIPVFEIEKKRESYRAININGLKCTLSFTSAIYTNKQAKKSNYKVELFEVDSETINKATDYELFTKILVFEFPKLVETDHSDFLIAKNNLIK